MTMPTSDIPEASSPSPPPGDVPQKLFTFSSGGWVLLLAGFFTVVAALLVLYPVMVNGLHPAVGDGKHVESYGFDLSNLMLPREQLAASGNPKDQIDAIPPRLVETITPQEVRLIAENEHIRFLVPGDRVIGLVINGEARAYPVRVLALHELVNDVVGGVPVAVSWSPLCDSAVVWDRRIDGESAAAVEFGVSGLLVNSNPVYYDRRKDAKGESLWPQLQLRAVSGPAAGKAMKLVPYELATWQEWTGAHPETRVLLGLRRRKKEYGSEPYAVYLYQDDVKFPVNPLWSDPQIRRMTPIVVMSGDEGKTWVAHRSTDAAANAGLKSAGERSAYRLHTFLFAWYAQHRGETDFSAIK
jgi:hypothetical protein